ncbi:CVNH domain-containing protein [Dactylonectria estremocensis]|uniref:CVNH domain-containing protein n=1 Tax=Dactylonectria estremocensis TaxID=1079267 RepID=A0A9P9FKK5_9HYPO|nr:CVNH domain-containing protein [Dactylonectria estremocensis]
MKFLATLSLFAASAIAADWGKTCSGEVLDDTTGTLTAKCDTGDGQGTLSETELDLYGCLKYSDGKISAPGGDGTFGDVCNDCTIYRLDDALYGSLIPQRPWISCTCNGASEPATLNLDITSITNVFGVLVCSR